MTTTLIVRDALLAIQGAPEKRPEARVHLRERVAEVTKLEHRAATECVEVLSSVAEGDGADPDVLEALVIVALARADVASELELPTVATGRRLAARVASADLERAKAILELLTEHFPAQESLERDLAQLERRQGTVQDLTDRYFERAQKLLREGRASEAAGWLREVLQLDPTRKDAARMVRDLRFKKVTGTERKRGGHGYLVVTLVLAGGLSYLGLREFRVREEFRALPSVAAGNSAALHRRLADLEQFVERHPLWHGALGVLAERAELRVQMAVLDEQARAEHEAAERALRERAESAQLCRQRGLLLAQGGDLRGAVVALREALDYGGPDWNERERVARDISDLEASLEQQP
ncbi:MAG: hypothetical protein EXS08_03485 [Planctomycetes bacterium]|nr:hypothetical protein [Planctomycetota bacterium]